MKKHTPLLSIAIPTKNRQYYCEYAIKTILSYKQDNFELIIQDNSDDDALAKFVSTIKDSRLKYFYDAQPLASNKNMDISIAKCTGDYVCMIGDDDTVLPEIFEVVEYMQKNDIDSVCATYIPKYGWPNKELNINGRLAVSKLKNQKKYDFIDIKSRLEKLFRSGIVEYGQYNLPRVYHGIVKREKLEAIKQKVGCYFGGLSPDIYSTISLSVLVDKHAVLDRAISIGGYCPQSTAGQTRAKGHMGELKDAPHLKHKEDYQWDKLVPRFYSVQTIWAESAIKAARDFGLDDLVTKFNCEKLMVEAFKDNEPIQDIIMRESLVSTSALSLKIQGKLQDYMFFIKRVCLYPFKVRIKKQGLTTIADAVAELQKNARRLQA